MDGVKFPVEAKKSATVRHSIPKPEKLSPQNKNIKPVLINQPTPKQGNAGTKK